MPDPRILTLDGIKGLANRLSAAAGSMKVLRPLRTDLVLTALLLRVLLRTGIVAGPIDLGGQDG